MKNNKEAQFMYKCRMCGKEVPCVYSGPQSADNHLINALYKTAVNNQLPPPMTTIHKCSKDQAGIAELMGYIIKETK